MEEVFGLHGTPSWACCTVCPGLYTRSVEYGHFSIGGDNTCVGTGVKLVL